MFLDLGSQTLDLGFVWCMLMEVCCVCIIQTNIIFTFSVTLESIYTYYYTPQIPSLECPNHTNPVLHRGVWLRHAIQFHPGLQGLNVYLSKDKGITEPSRNTRLGGHILIQESPVFWHHVEYQTGFFHRVEQLHVQRA